MLHALPGSHSGLTLHGDTPVLPTFKQGTDFSPAGNASLAGVLAQGCLQEEDGNTTGEQEDHVGDEERT